MKKYTKFTGSALFLKQLSLNISLLVLSKAFCVLRYLNHVRAAMPQDTAGGYTSALACYRAIQDAFSGLFPPKG